MDLERVLAELRRERDALEAAILNLERLAHSGKPVAERPAEFSPKSHANSANGSFGDLTGEESN